MAELQQRCEAVEAEHKLFTRDQEAPASVQLATALGKLTRKLQEAAAERDVLEGAFRTQMEDVQRNFSAKAIEAETLRRQLSEAKAKDSATPSTPKASPPSAGAATPSPKPDDAEKDKVIGQLRQRLSAEQEERETLVGHMREHMMQLARENTELRAKQTAAESDPPHDASPAMEPVGTRTPEQACSEAKPASEPLLSTAAATQEPSEHGGRNWLSFVLSPFLTDGDMRELHAESYIDEQLRKGPP